MGGGLASFLLCWKLEQPIPPFNILQHINGTALQLILKRHQATELSNLHNSWSMLPYTLLHGTSKFCSIEPSRRKANLLGKFHRSSLSSMSQNGIAVSQCVTWVHGVWAHAVAQVIHLPSIEKYTFIF